MTPTTEPVQPRMIGIPITKITLTDFVEVVRDVYGTSELPHRHISFAERIGGRYLDTRTGEFVSGRDAMQFYDPSDPWALPPWLLTEDRVFNYKICSGSQLTRGVWRGHYIKDIMEGANQLGRRGLEQITADEGVLTDFLNAVEVVEYATRAGKGLVV